MSGRAGERLGVDRGRAYSLNEGLGQGSVLESNSKVTVPLLAKKVRAPNPTPVGCVTRGRIHLSKK